MHNVCVATYYHKYCNVNISLFYFTGDALDYICGEILNYLKENKTNLSPTDITEISSLIEEDKREEAIELFNNLCSEAGDFFTYEEKEIN